MENLDIWVKFDKPPKAVLKEIRAGRLKGKSDINPQWRLKAMTETFGPCGTGWGYKIIDRWKEDYNDETAVFICVEIWYFDKDGKSEMVQGIGGSKLVTKESSGPYLNDEAYKMALTDALSVAMKALGVGAEIYLGNYDGSKYVDESRQLPAKPATMPEDLKPVTPQPQKDMGTFTGLIESIEEKSGQSAKGPWTAFKIGSNGVIMTTFDKTIAEHCRQAFNGKIKVEFETQPSKYGPELLAIHSIKEEK